MPRKSNPSSQVIINQSNNPVNPVNQVDDNNIQADKYQPPQQVQQAPPMQVEKKPKRVATPKQIENLNKGRAISLANKAERDRLINEEKAEMKRRVDELERQLKEQKQLEFENKLIKKAVQVKTKQLKREKVLDSIVGDEETQEVVQKEVAKRQAPKQAPPVQQQQPRVPKFVFV